jgi:hypothetical protein
VQAREASPAPEFGRQSLVLERGFTNRRADLQRTIRASVYAIRARER